MSRRNIGSEILEGIAEIKQFKREQSGLRFSGYSKTGGVGPVLGFNSQVHYQPDFILQVHHQFYSRIPESLRQIKDAQGSAVGTVVPGAWRTRSVRVGQHVPPVAEPIEG